MSKSLEHVQISAYWHLHRALYISLLAHRSQTLGHDKFLPMTPHAYNCHPYINEKSTFGSLHAFSSIQLCNTHVIDDTRMVFVGLNQTFASTCTHLPSRSCDRLYHKLSTSIEFLNLKDGCRKTSWYFCYLITTFNVDISESRFKGHVKSFSNVVD